MKEISTMFIILLLVLFSCSPSDSETVSVQNEVPEKVELLFPEDNTECHEGTLISENQSEVPFRWTESNNTDFYEVFLENLESGTQSLTLSDINETNIIINRATAYKWHIVSKSNSSEESTKSESSQFYNAGEEVVGHAPFPATVLFPVSGSEVVANSDMLDLRWSGNDLDNDIISFEVFYGTENPPTNNSGKLNENTYSLDVSKNHRYYWRVLTYDSSGNSSQSEVSTFRTK